MSMSKSSEKMLSAARHRASRLMLELLLTAELGQRSEMPANHVAPSWSNFRKAPLLNGAN
jgi:hypothetical protein